MWPSVSSVHQPGELLGVIEASLKISQRHQFFMWTQGELQAWLPHEALICCLFGRDGQCSQVQQFAWKPYYKDADLLQLCQSRHGVFAEAVWAWEKAGCAVQLDLRDLEAEFISPVGAPIFEPRVDSFRAAAHGMRGHDGKMVGLFVLLGVPEFSNESRLRALELVTPHMYAALVRVLPELGGQENSFLSAQISGREQEILKLISAGKTNPEIGMILYISPFTVKNHVKNIFKKLNVTSRSQAVAVALSRCLIDSHTHQ